jgi:hypothetical protein
VSLRIVECDAWGARPARLTPARAGRPHRVIDHHTAGHAPELDHLRGESLREAKAYARALQHFHMAGNGWNDSGHNFLVSRGGHVLEGRRGTLAALRRGVMIVSAHCPGQNDQPGVEHEQLGDEPLTAAQKEASILLHVWLCRHAPTIKPSQFYGHGHFFPTSCPGQQVGAWIPQLRRHVACELARR